MIDDCIDIGANLRSPLRRCPISDIIMGKRDEATIAAAYKELKLEERGYKLEQTVDWVKGGLP